MEARFSKRVVALLALLAVVGWPGAHRLVRAQDVILRAPEFDGPQLQSFPEADSILQAPPEQTFAPDETVLPEETTLPEPEIAPQSLLPETTGEPVAPSSPPSVIAPIPEAAAGCPTCQPGGYWIVSSRHCSSACKNGRGRCPLRYFYLGPDGRAQVIPEQNFVGSLQPNVPVCIVVHGSFHSWESVVRGSRQLYRWMIPPAANVPTNVVFFTWPSEKPNTMVFTLDFAILGRRSEYHGTYLAELISKIPADRPISLFGHSHGVRTVSAALHLRAGGEVDGIRHGRAPDLDRRIRVVFAAAAIDNNWLVPGQRFGMVLRGTESFVNLRNQDDMALSLYPFRRVFSGEALAKTGITPAMRRAMGQWSAKVSEIDVTRQIGSGHMLYNYVEHPEIAQAIAPAIFYLDRQPAIGSELPSQASPIPPAPAQVEPETNQSQIPVPQRNALNARPARIRETYSNVGRVRPVGRL